MSESDPLIGQRVNNYEITRHLGQGGMGVVYQARHITLERDVAVKFLAAHLATNSDYVERFLREARAAARLNHANLIGVHDAGVEGDVYYIVMEYVDGSDLVRMLKEQNLFTEEETIYIGLKTAEALGYAHRQGIIHRDIKPENLILTSAGELKVADLGLAKQLNSEDSSMTMSGMVVGTPYYISPEQVRGSKDVDARTDIYSLGVTLFHLATGQVPFKGNSSAEIMSKHLTENPPPAQDINRNLSDGFSRVLAQMMSKETEKRHQTMEEVSLALDGVLHGHAPTPQIGATVLSDAPKRVLRVPVLPSSPLDATPVAPGDSSVVASPTPPVVATATPGVKKETVVSLSHQQPKIKFRDVPVTHDALDKGVRQRFVISNVHFLLKDKSSSTLLSSIFNPGLGPCLHAMREYPSCQYHKTLPDPNGT